MTTVLINTSKYCGTIEHQRSYSVFFFYVVESLLDHQSPLAWEDQFEWHIMAIMLIGWHGRFI